MVEVFSQPGSFGFERLIDAAHVRRLPDGVRELSWGVGLQAVTDGTTQAPGFDVAVAAHRLADAVYRSAALEGAPVRP